MHLFLFLILIVDKGSMPDDERINNPRYYTGVLREALPVDIVITHEWTDRNRPLWHVCVFLNGHKTEATSWSRYCAREEACYRFLVLFNLIEDVAEWGHV